MRLNGLLVVLGIAAVLAVRVGGQATSVNQGRRVADRIVVVFKSATLPANAGDRIRDAGGRDDDDQRVPQVAKHSPTQFDAEVSPA